LRTIKRICSDTKTVVEQKRFRAKKKHLKKEAKEAEEEKNVG
jgi:hypothetical protein